MAAEGSTLAASKRLGLNQTTVSRRVAALEQALGLTPFDRDTRGHSLTPQGSAMIHLAGQFGAAAENLRLHAGHLVRMTEGTIRVTAARAGMEHRGLPLIARKLPPVAWGVYCSRVYRDRLGMPSGPEQMSRHPVLTYPDPMIGNVALMSWLNGFVDPDKVVGTVDSVITMSASLRCTDAVGVLPCVEGDAIADLVRCFAHGRLTSGLWLVASRDAYREDRGRSFMSFAGDTLPRDGGPVRF